MRITNKTHFKIMIFPINYYKCSINYYINNNKDLEDCDQCTH